MSCNAGGFSMPVGSSAPLYCLMRVGPPYDSVTWYYYYGACGPYGSDFSCAGAVPISFWGSDLDPAGALDPAFDLPAGDEPGTFPYTFIAEACNAGQCIRAWTLVTVTVKPAGTP